MKLKFISLLLFSFVLSFSVEASKPPCKVNFLKLININPSNTPFIPFNALLDSEKNTFEVYEWALKRSQLYLGPGIAYMYGLAESAADIIIKEMGISHLAVEAGNIDGNILLSFAHTIDIIRNQKPKYIKNATILSSNGIYTVAPILKLDEETGLYMPLVVKGHQDLRREDKLLSAFIAMALEPYQGGIPNLAEVHLRPMIERRVRPGEEDPNSYTIVVNNYQYHFDYLYQQFMNEHQAFITKITALKKEFNHKYPDSIFDQEKFFNEVVSPLITENKLSLRNMPYAPSREDIIALNLLGIKNKEDLAKVDINSENFVDICLTTGISPQRLKYFVLRSRSTIQDKLILTESYTDFVTKDTEYLVHIDFETLMARQNTPGDKSGVFYIGAEIQSTKEIALPIKEEDRFFFGGVKEFSQQNVDENWAALFRLLKNDSRLKNGKFKITIFSKHETVKLAQLLDILKLKPDEFTAAEKASKFYREFEVYEPIPGILGSTPRFVKKGFLIRRQDFFEKFPDITVDDAFNFLEKSVDLLPYFRHNFAGPSRSNGLKSVLSYVQENIPEELKLQYAVGDNGLNAIGWYIEYTRTHDESIRERIKEYLKLDIDSNRLVSDFLRRHAGEVPHLDNAWNDNLKAMLTKAKRSLQLRNFYRNLTSKHQLLTKLFGKNISDLTNAEIEKLANFLERSNYLQERKIIMEDEGLDEMTIRTELQGLQHTFESSRLTEIHSFLKTVNPNIGDTINPEISALLYQLFNDPVTSLTPVHIARMLAYEQLLQRMEEVFPIVTQGMDRAQLKAQALDTKIFPNSITKTRGVDSWLDRNDLLLVRVYETEVVENGIKKTKKNYVVEYGRAHDGEIRGKTVASVQEIWLSLYLDFIYKELQ